MRGSSLRPLGGVLALLLSGSLGISAASAQEDPVQSPRGGLVLIPRGNSARLEFPDGRVLRIDLPNRGVVSSLAAIPAINDGWVAAGSYSDSAGQRRLFLFTGDDKSFRKLPEPPGQQEQGRRGPALLVDDSRLVGLAWLEGDGIPSLSVRAAAWNGQRWQAIQQVSHPGPGSQLGLTGAVLGDGSWLLAWSAFDGTADEIVWSRRVGQEWLQVSRVSTPNAVPDITPALIATAGTASDNALLAWSRYDGHTYQLRMARFERGEWRDEHASAPSGSLYPAFLGGPDRPRLLYLEASPRGWSVLDLDGEGRVRAKASVSSSSSDRPVVSFAGGSVRMRWPAAKREGMATLEKVP
jgi:hypothetical protein